MEDNKVLDHIILELRKNREELFRNYENDPLKLVEGIKKQKSENQKAGFKYMSLKPKLVLKNTGS
jgi:hypothetical protein